MNGTPNPKEVFAKVRRDFIVNCTDKLASMQETINRIGSPGTSYDNLLSEIKRETHSLKGLGGTFGFPTITHIAHALEDYIEMVGSQNKIAPNVLHQFLDPICQILESGNNPNEDWTGRILAALPLQQRADSGKVMETTKNALIAMPKDLWRTIAGQELLSLGYKIAMADTVINAIDRGLTLKPELIVIGMQLDRSTGLELAGVFAQFQGTSNAKIIILSASTDTDTGQFSRRPNTAVIHKGPKFPTDLREFLHSPVTTTSPVP